MTEVDKLTDMENDSWTFIKASQARYGERSGLDFLGIWSRPNNLYFTLLHKSSLTVRLSQWVRHSELEFLRRRNLCKEFSERGKFVKKSSVSNHYHHYHHLCRNHQIAIFILTVSR